MAPGDDPVQIGPFRLELVRMAHSIPDAAAVVLETPGGTLRPHRRLQARPHAGRRPAHRRRQARRASATAASTCCSATRRTPSGPASPSRSASSARRSARSSRTAPAASLVTSFASNVHRMQQAADVASACGRKVAFVGRSMRKNANIARNLGYMDVPDDTIMRPHDLDRAAAGRAADPLHRQPGRADVRDDADRLQRPSVGAHRARRHGDHLREADPRERAARPRRDQPAREARAPRCCTRTTRPCTSPATAARRSCARSSRSCARRP